jgi:hypothetical protein
LKWCIKLSLAERNGQSDKKAWSKWLTTWGTKLCLFLFFPSWRCILNQFRRWRSEKQMPAEADRQAVEAHTTWAYAWISWRSQ